MNFIGIFFVLLWASGYIASVIGLQSSDPITFMTFRMLIAFLLFIILYLYKKAHSQKTLF
ncbi:MAG: hypothetical protein CENE_00737 [Candidatus Celerinatantimonas neptuna]|nr:MAG: hypothetical protein CENE_00737 [Candidatus Celerinatantimonas neptuna]